MVLPAWLRWLGVLLVLAVVAWAGYIGSERLQAPDAYPLRQVRIEVNCAIWLRWICSRLPVPIWASISSVPI